MTRRAETHPRTTLRAHGGRDATIRLLLAAAVLAVPAGGAAAQEAPIPPSPLALPMPPAPDWTRKLSFHAEGGWARHALSARATPTASMMLGLAFRLDANLYLEAEAWTMKFAEVRDCPDFALACPVDRGTRMLALAYGFRIDSDTRPVAGFLALHGGLELDGPYRMTDVGAGGRVAISGRLALRLELRHRWDYRFAAGDPIGGSALLFGVEVRGSH